MYIFKYNCNCLHSSIGFVWTDSGSRGSVEVPSVRSHQKLLLCPTGAMPADSKTDLPLGEAEPISDGGSDTGITDFKKGKEYCTTACGREQ